MLLAVDLASLVGVKLASLVAVNMASMLGMQLALLDTSCWQWIGLCWEQ